MVQNTETSHCNTPHSKNKEGGKKPYDPPQLLNTKAPDDMQDPFVTEAVQARNRRTVSPSAPGRPCPWGETAGSPWAGGRGRRPSFPSHCRGHGAALGRRKGIWIGKGEARPHHHVSTWHENPEESPKPAGAKKQVQQSLRIRNWQKQVVSRHKQWPTLFLLTTKI